MSKKRKAAFIVPIVVLAVGIFFSAASWRLAQQDLDATRTELYDTQATLASSNVELTRTNDELLVTRAELQDTKDDLSSMEAELEDTRDSLSRVQAELGEAKLILSAIPADMFHVHNPTFAEAVRFLRADKTDRNEYLEDEYVCSHFARDVNNNAESQGIRCASVDIRFPHSAHAIIAFNTIDQGMVYFDPQTDDKVSPVIGKRYWQCIEPRPDYRYEAPSYNDTIRDIIITW
ncbi:MAG: hypothetical protein J7K77_00265 [Dehalococcoidales bacterium]|nr:hypothetical protein [Dehalococcoidales bacterium]